MFNPDARIERVRLAPGRDAWVVDDVLSAPHIVRDWAVRARGLFSASPYNAYPGLEWRMGPEVSAPLSEFFMLRLRRAMGLRRTLSMYSRLSLATLQPGQLSPLQRLCHRDRLGAVPGQAVMACTLYLFDAPALGGTGFYAPRRPLADLDADIRRWSAMSADNFTAELGAPPAYLVDSNRHFELLGAVPAAFNRAIFYDGSAFHSSHITAPEKLTDDPATGRLTLNGFFLCQPTAV
jgi:hypothetical protein